MIRAAIAAAVTALAAGLEEPGVAAPVIAPIQPTSGPSFAGGYAGGSLGAGNLVFGPEIAVFGGADEIDGSILVEDGAAQDDDDVGVDLDYAARLAARGGYAFGPNLVHGLAGVAYADIDSRLATLGDDDSDFGHAVGLGYERLIGERVVLGAQYRLHAFEEFGDGDDAEDLDYRTLEARLSIEF